jgi:DNA-binding transcriptional MocR family regulator
LVPAIERAIRATTWNTAALTTAIACRWIDDGTVDELEAAKRADASRRQSIAAQVLAGVPQLGHPSSYFVWLPLAPHARADRIASSLERERISVSTAEPFAISAPVPQAIRLALGSTEPEPLRTALLKVREVVDAETYR